MHDLENMVENFQNRLACKAKGEYPPVRVEEKNEHYARLLLNPYANSKNSEFTAISQYLYHHHTIENNDVSMAELCIALVEMKHFGILGDLIELLGGDPKYKDYEKDWWISRKVGYGEDLCEKLQLDIDAELTAIEEYEDLLCEIKDCHIQKIIRRIIEDERVHSEIFTTLYKKYCNKKTDCNK